MTKPGLSVVVAVAASYAVLGCASEPSSEGHSYVLLDAEARSAGVVVQLQGDFIPTLPLAFDPSDGVVVRAAGKSNVVDAAPRRLIYVRGKAAAIETLELGTDALEDRLLLDGPEEAVRELARTIGGDLSPRADGYSLLTAPDLFERTSYLKPPDDLREALPDTGMEARGDAELAVSSSGKLLLPTSGNAYRVPSRFGDAALVGLYSTATTSLVLNAAGGFTLDEGCGGGASREGHFRLEGDKLLLTSERDFDVVLRVTPRGLVNADGARFAAMGGEP